MDRKVGQKCAPKSTIATAFSPRPGHCASLPCSSAASNADQNATRCLPCSLRARFPVCQCPPSRPAPDAQKSTTPIPPNASRNRRFSDTCTSAFSRAARFPVYQSGFGRLEGRAGHHPRVLHVLYGSSRVCVFTRPKTVPKERRKNAPRYMIGTAFWHPSWSSSERLLETVPKQDRRGYVGS